MRGWQGEIRTRRKAIPPGAAGGDQATARGLLVERGIPSPRRHSLTGTKWRYLSPREPLWVAGRPIGERSSMKPTRTLPTYAAALLVVSSCGFAPALELPINNHPLADHPPVVSVCAPGEPNCVETSVGVDVDEPESEQFPDSTGTTFHGELTVSEAVGFAGEGTLAVHGYLFFDEDGDSLCEELAPGGERYECGGARLPVEDLSFEFFGDLIVHHDGLTYSQEPVSVLGDLVDGVLIVHALASG